MLGETPAQNGNTEPYPAGLLAAPSAVVLPYRSEDISCPQQVGQTRNSKRGQRQRLNTPIRKRCGKSSHSRKKLAGRDGGYSQAEVDSLLEIFEENVLVGGEEWAHAMCIHKQHYPEKNRDVDSLKRKFASVHRRGTPTGDQLCAQDVRKATNIRQK